MNSKFFLPGTHQQQKIFLSKVNVKNFKVLVIGSGTEEISLSFYNEGASKVIMIVEDDDSLLKSRLLLANEKEINVRMMDFDNTDFADSNFDLVFAQASISNKKRNKIVKEVKRILKPEGYFCIGENISFSKSPPEFVKDIWESSEISPLFSEELRKYYEAKDFQIIHEHDLSHTLKDFYQQSSSLLKEKSNNLSDQEKSYYKKLLKRISHESNVYLNLGGDIHIGFRMLILKKGLS